MDTVLKFEDMVTGCSYILLRGLGRPIFVYSNIHSVCRYRKLVQIGSGGVLISLAFYLYIIYLCFCGFIILFLFGLCI